MNHSTCRHTLVLAAIAKVSSTSTTVASSVPVEFQTSLTASCRSAR